MRRPGTTTCLTAAASAGLLAAAIVEQAAMAGCTGCGECVPACRGTWDEKKSSKPVYSMTCERVCVRGSDSWHAPPPECRCQPPCGTAIVKKRFYKADGPERIERVPKYEVAMVPVEPPQERCAPCAATGGCSGQRGWWSPLDFLRRCAAWW